MTLDDPAADRKANAHAVDLGRVEGAENLGLSCVAGVSMLAMSMVLVLRSQFRVQAQLSRSRVELSIG